MKHPLSDALIDEDFPFSNYRGMDLWVAVEKTTTDFEFEKIFNEISCRETVAAKWSGLSALLGALLDQKKWKLFFRVVATMRAFFIENNLNPGDERFGHWKYMIFVSSYALHPGTREDLEIADIVIGELSFFEEDCYFLIRRMSRLYFELGDIANYKKCREKFVALERNLPRGVSYEDIFYINIGCYNDVIEMKLRTK